MAESGSRTTRTLDHARRRLRATETGATAFVVVHRDGSRSRLGRRPGRAPGVRLAYPDGRRAMHGMGIDLVAASGDTIYVADTVTGVIGVYTTDGRLRAALSPPPDLINRGFDRFRAIDEGFPARNYFTPLYKDLSILSDGRLLALVGVGDVVALVIEPAERTMAYVEAPAGAAGADARAAFSAAVTGERFVVAGLNGLSLYRVTLP